MLTTHFNLVKDTSGCFTLVGDEGGPDVIFDTIGKVGSALYGGDVMLCRCVATDVVYLFIVDTKQYIPLQNTQGQLYKYNEHTRQLVPQSKYTASV